MALTNTFSSKNLVVTDDFRETIFTRSVAGKTVLHREAHKSYEYIGMTRASAALCVMAKQAQYLIPAYTVDDRGNESASLPLVRANVNPRYIAGDDWGVSVSFDIEDELVIGTNPSDRSISSALHLLRLLNADEPTDMKPTIYIPRIVYGVNYADVQNGDGRVFLPDSFVDTFCSTRPSGATYELAIETTIDPLDQSSWGRSVTYEDLEGVRVYKSLPKYPSGSVVYSRFVVAGLSGGFGNPDCFSNIVTYKFGV